MKNKSLIRIIKYTFVTNLILICAVTLYGQKLPTDTTFSENLSMNPNHALYPGDHFDIYFDMTGFRPGTIYGALMHTYDEEICIGTSIFTSPIHAMVPWETVPGNYGIKVVAASAIPVHPKIIVVRDSLKFNPEKWISVSGNDPGYLTFNGTGDRVATLKEANVTTGGMIQVDFKWLQANRDANSSVIVEYSTNNGGLWKQFYSFSPAIEYTHFITMYMPSDASTDHTLVRFRQPRYKSTDGWKLNHVLETKIGNVIMPNYYENIHFTVLGNNIKIKPLPSKDICAGAKFKLEFTTSGNYMSDNNFIAQLSDRDGQFDNPVDVGNRNGTTSGVINVTLPDNLSEGIRYRIRIIAVAGGHIRTTSPPTPNMELGHNVAMNIVENRDTLTAPDGTAYQWYKDDALIPGATNKTLVASNSGSYSCAVTNGMNCSIRSTALPVVIQDTKDRSEDDEYFQVYPNPANDIITITSKRPLSGKVEVKIMNSMGGLVSNKGIDNFSGSEITIPMDGYLQGMYYLIITDSEGSAVKPIVKK